MPPVMRPRCPCNALATPLQRPPIAARTSRNAPCSAPHNLRRAMRPPPKCSSNHALSMRLVCVYAVPARLPACLPARMMTPLRAVRAVHAVPLIHVQDSARTALRLVSRHVTDNRAGITKQEAAQLHSEANRLQKRVGCQGHGESRYQRLEGLSSLCGFWYTSYVLYWLKRPGCAPGCSGRNNSG